MSDVLPSPPPGLNYIAIIQPSLTYILVLVPLGAALVPLILTLFFFSTPQIRRHPVFILNILACCCGICEASINATLGTKQILYPLEQTSKSLLTAAVAFSVVPPLFIDSILVFRLLAFYPVRTTPTTKLVKILALPVLIKCGRFIALVMFLHSFTSASGNGPNVLLAAGFAWSRERRYPLTEFCLQTLDSLYASSLFLYNLRKCQRDMTITRTSPNSRILQRIRAALLIAVENFVFPVIANLVAISLFAWGSSYTTASYIFLVNDYVAILGVVFATMWTSRRNWNHHETIDEHSSFDPSGSMDAVSVMQFAQASFLNAPYSSPETVELPIVDGSSGSTFGEKSGNDDFSHPASR